MPIPPHSIHSVKSAREEYERQGEVEEDWLIAGQPADDGGRAIGSRRQLFVMTRMKYFLFCFVLREKEEKTRNRFLCAARAIDQLNKLRKFV